MLLFKSVQMAQRNYIFVVVVIAILPFVENASINMGNTGSKMEELRSKLVFVDGNADGITNRDTEKVAAPLKMDDERQIWGIAVDNVGLIEDESYYDRPLALPKTINKIPKQASARRNHENRAFNNVPKETRAPKPSACDMAVIICCENRSNFKECFISQGCFSVTNDTYSNVCSSDSINRAIQNLGRYYKGRQAT